VSLSAGQIFSLDRYGRWETSKGISKRGADSVLLPRGLKEGLLDDARRFLSAETRRWYADRELRMPGRVWTRLTWHTMLGGIPYRRGLLLYGIPGSGKSSMVHVIASELGLAIYTVSLSARGVDDASFLELMGAVPPRSIVLLEDVDAAFVERSGGSGKPPISFSTLLNAIDGVGAAESRILVLTTNHRERLDEVSVAPAPRFLTATSD
jgi:chaperone BCS1